MIDGIHKSQTAKVSVKRRLSYTALLFSLFLVLTTGYYTSMFGYVPLWPAAIQTTVVGFIIFWYLGGLRRL